MGDEAPSPWGVDLNLLMRFTPMAGKVVMTRQSTIQKGIIRIEQFSNGSIFAKDVIEEEYGFFLHILKQHSAKTWKDFSIRLSFL
jgi:hypothetical protein